MCDGECPSRASRRDEQRGRSHVDRLGGHGVSPFEVDERDVAGGQQSGIDRAELDHSAVVSPRGAVGEVEIGLVFPLVEATVVEGVEQQLALHADEVEHPGPVLGEERTGCCEVLAVHHLDGLVRRGTRRCGVVRRAGRRLRRCGPGRHRARRRRSVPVRWRSPAVRCDHECPDRRGRAASSAAP